jgi:hypothetical protein
MLKALCIHSAAGAIAIIEQLVIVIENIAATRDSLSHLVLCDAALVLRCTLEMTAQGDLSQSAGNSAKNACGADVGQRAASRGAITGVHRAEHRAAGAARSTS